MELAKAIARRHMVRAFARSPVPDADLDRLLDLARRAPSAGNTQAVGFVVLDDPSLTDRYWNITLAGPKRERFRWQRLLNAPVLVLVTTEPDAYPRRYAESDKASTGLGGSIDDWPIPYWYVDAGAVIQNLLLLAVDAGLGACLFGPFGHEPAIRSEFELDSGTRITATIALGYPLTDEPGRSSGRRRRSPDDVIRRPARRPEGRLPDRPESAK